MLCPFATASRRKPMSTTTTTTTMTTTTRDRGDRYGPIEWAKKGGLVEDGILHIVTYKDIGV